MDYEEGFTITAAWEFIHNTGWPIEAYQFTDWEGGSLVLVLLSIPFCLIFGPSLFALKITAILLSSLTLSALYLLGKENYGAKTALLICLFYIFSFDPVLSYSLIAKGFHPDSIALQILFIWGFTWIINNQNCRWHHFFSLGILGGFGIYFAYIFILTPIACFSIIVRRLLNKKDKIHNQFMFKTFFCGFIIGMIPLFIFNIKNNFVGFFIHGQSLKTFFLMNDYTDFAHHLCVNIPNTMIHISNYEGPDELKYIVFNVIFWTISLFTIFCACIQLINRNYSENSNYDRHYLKKTCLNQIVLGYVFSFLLIIILVDYNIMDYHLAPLIVILMIAIAEKTITFWNQNNRIRKLFSLAIIFIFLGFGVFVNLKKIHWNYLGISLMIDARDYIQFYSRVLNTYQRYPDKKNCSPLLITLPPEFKENTPIIHRFFRDAPGDLLKGGIVKISEKEKNMITGYGLGSWYLLDPNVDRRRKITMYINDCNAAHQKDLLQGLSYGLPISFSKLFLADDIHDEIKKEWWNHWLSFGMGRSITLSTFLYSKEMQSGEIVNPKLRNSFFLGFGYELGLKIQNTVPPSIIDKIPTLFQKSFWEGIDMANSYKSTLE